MSSLKKEIGTAKVAFEGPFRAHVDYQSPETDPLSRERDALQLFALTFVKILFLLGENKQAPMLLQYVQAAMGDTVTPKGLNRPIILGKGQELLETPPEKAERVMELKLIQEEEGRLAELVLPLGDEGQAYPATVVFFLQYLLRTLNEASLFFLMLVLGGIMEYYDRVGKTNDVQALVGAPAHGFSTAVKYIEEEKGKIRDPE